MTNHQRTSQSEHVEQRALEQDIVAQLSPDKQTQAKAKAKADRLRRLLERTKARERKTSASRT